MSATSGTFNPLEHLKGDPLEIPNLARGAMAASKPYVATPAHQKALGFPRRVGRELAGEGHQSAW